MTKETTLWAKLSTTLRNSDKWLHAEDENPRAACAYIDSILFSFENDTDGIITTMQLRRQICADADVIDYLLRLRMWEEMPDGIRIHDYLDWQESKQDREHRKAVAQSNGAKGGRPRKSDGIVKTKSVSETETKPNTRVEKSREDKIRKNKSTNAEETDSSDNSYLQTLRMQWRKKGGDPKELQSLFQSACDKVGALHVISEAQKYIEATKRDETQYTKSLKSWLSDPVNWTPAPREKLEKPSEHDFNAIIESHPELDYIEAKKTYFQHFDSAIQARIALAEKFPDFLLN